MKRIVDIPNYNLDEVQNGSIACGQILKAVKDSKPVSIDDNLVSRKYLEDAFDNLCCHNCKICRNFRNEDSFYKCALIDNAPPVKFSLMPADETKEDAYKRGYEKGKVEGMLKAYARPQGEWIIIDDTEKFIAKCSVCGRIEDSRMVKDYPYCRCGAKMKGCK